MREVIGKGELKEVGEGEGTFGEVNTRDVNLEKIDDFLGELVVFTELEADRERLGAVVYDLANFGGEVL